MEATNGNGNFTAPQMAAAAAPIVPPNGNFLLEDGTELLLEDGTNLLLEG